MIFWVKSVKTKLIQRNLCSKCCYWQRHCGKGQRFKKGTNQHPIKTNQDPNSTNQCTPLPLTWRTAPVEMHQCFYWNAPICRHCNAPVPALKCTNACVEMHQCLRWDAPMPALKCTNALRWNAPMPALRCTDACVKMHQCLRWNAPMPALRCTNALVEMKHCPLLKWNTCWIYIEERHGLWSERRRKSREKTGKIWILSEVSHSRAPAYPLLVVHGHGICVLFGLFPQHFLHGEPFFW